MTPRSYLFVPGNRPERFSKALASGADRVIVDLEDAVAPDAKDAARQAAASWLQTLDAATQAQVLVRINDAFSPFYANDLAWLRSQPLTEVMLAKCESPQQVSQVLASMSKGVHVMPLIETVRGVMEAQVIAQTVGVSRLAFGSIDYQLDLDVPEASLALDQAAIHLAMVSRIAQKPAPVAGVTAQLDTATLRADWQHARSLGFGAKLCIHPQQVQALHDAMQPEASTVAWAQRVVSAWDQHGASGAAQVDGQMVDKPVLLRAQRILSQARP
jgi:citrate lyase subunit beta / citryl-CoA lyase